MPFDFEIAELEVRDLLAVDPDRIIAWLKRPVSGTYRNGDPANSGSILELRVDVDGRRPQDRLSGDLYSHFKFCGIPITWYTGSFVVENVTETKDDSSILLSGPVVYYADSSNTSDSIEVRIPRVKYFASPAAACVDWFTNGSLVRSYVCPKTSEYFRSVSMEIDRMQGTAFPPTLDPDVDPSPAGLPSSVSVREVFQRSGVDLTVTHDDTLNDPDSSDPGNNWDEAELHDLMEDRFDQFADRLQWDVYGVVVPRFGDPNYNANYYGTMFDWGGYQPGDSFLRQGFALAEDATRARDDDNLYDSAAQKDRLVLQTFIHEAGHAFNLPHSWQRGVNMDSGSDSFMNYPWGYTANGGTETDFWENFRWEFDDVELIWMRHADRNDVIFGGQDWIGNNLSTDLRPAYEQQGTPVSLEIRGPNVVDLGVPVHVELKLENTSNQPVNVIDRLQPEEGLTRVVIERPGGDVATFVPPVRRLMAPPESVELAPGKSTYSTIGLGFSAKGPLFSVPGEYLIRVYYPCFPHGYIATATKRLRVAYPLSRRTEDLAHLLYSKEAAQFMYYGGSRHNPDTRDQLIEALDYNAETDPVAVRHIAAALGRDAARVHKSISTKKGKRVIVASDANPEFAAERFSEALAPLPKELGLSSAFDATTEGALFGSLANQHTILGHDKEAEEVLDSGIKRLKKDTTYATKDLQKQVRNLKRSNKK